MPRDEVLSGGVANAGRVVRRGEVVVRPAGPHSQAIHALLRHLAGAGFDGAPTPLAEPAMGEEQLGFIVGDVPLPPYPRWARSDDALRTIAALLRRFHVAQEGFDAANAMSWSDELRDPSMSTTVICHNDVCPENVVFRDRRAVALLDFDFAAPGRPEYDLAQLAKMCVPLDTDDDARRTGRDGLDPFTRLRTVADGYGLPANRAPFIAAIQDAIDVGTRFVQSRVRRGEQAFVQMWEAMGGQERSERRQGWFDAHRQEIADALE